MDRSSRPRRGDVWAVSLDPTVGHEIKKTRPAIVVTSDLYNANNWVIIVMPVTSRDEAEYDQVQRLLFSCAANLAEFGCSQALAHALLIEPGLMRRRGRCTPSIAAMIAASHKIFVNQLKPAASNRV